MENICFGLTESKGNLYKFYLGDNSLMEDNINQSIKPIFYCSLDALFPLFAFMQMLTLKVLSIDIISSSNVSKSPIGMFSPIY